MRSLQNISLDLLRVFHQTASLGSMVAASRVLFITQPAVSHAVRQLEEQLECRLFERKNRRLTLTDEGEVLHGTTALMFGMLEAGNRELADLRARKTGLLRIGCPLLIMQTCLTERLDAFHYDHPNVRIRMKIENRMQPMLELLADNEIDLLVLATPRMEQIDAAFEEITLAQYRYAFVAERRHYAELTDRDVSWAEINSYPLVVLRPGNNTRDCLTRAFSEKGLSLNVVWETESMALTDEFTKAGFGLGIVIRSEIENAPPLPENLFEIRANPALPGGRYVALCKKSSLSNPAVADFLQELRKIQSGSPIRIPAH